MSHFLSIDSKRNFPQEVRSMNVLYVQELKKAEAQRKFRPYVDYEKII